jgi:pyrroline-5-carboxylate reductase
MRWDIGIVGLGRVGASLSRGLIRSGYPAELIAATGPRSAEGKSLATTGITLIEDLETLIGNSRTVLICVRGDQLLSLCESARSFMSAEQALVTFCAGVSYGAIEASLRTEERANCVLIKAIPNICMATGCGYTWVYFQPLLKEDDRVASTISLLGKLGDVRVAETEEALDQNSLLSGTFPALFALFFEAVVSAAVANAIPEPLAREMVARTTYGTLKTIEELKASTDQIVDWVATPGGLVERSSRSLGKNGALKEAASEWFSSIARESIS